MLNSNLNKKGESTPLPLIVLAILYACLVFTNPNKQEFQQFIINRVGFSDNLNKSFFGDLAKTVVAYGLDSVLSCNNYYAFTICEIEKNWITGSLGVDIKLIGIGGKIFNLKDTNYKFKKSSYFQTQDIKLDLESDEQSFRNAIEKELEKKNFDEKE